MYTFIAQKVLLLPEATREYTIPYTREKKSNSNQQQQNKQFKL